MNRTRSTEHRVFGSALALGALALLPAGPADAHFILREPASWMSQGPLGDPQKQGPCGTGPGGTATGTITAVQAGQTISVTITETIFHPGHYRIALSVHDRSELPPEPVVTPGTSPCGSVPIMNPPVFPVLADGVLAHTRPFSGPQTVQVTLPPDVACEHCTLQVIEFMSEHGLNNPGGCFYHHCADLSISQVAVTVDAGTAVDAGAAVDAGDTTVDAGSADSGAPSTVGTSSGGCSCGVASRPSPRGATVLGGLCALAFALRRRRSRGRV